MKCCISCGTCDKKYFCIIIGLTISFTFVVPFRISDNKLIVNENFLYCIFLFFLGYSLCFIPELIYKKSDKKKEINSSPRTTQLIHYIFNKSSSDTKFSIKEILIFFFICLILLFKYILIYLNVKYYFNISNSNTFINSTIFNKFSNNTHISTNNKNTTINENNFVNDEFIFFSYIIVFIVSAFVFKNTYYKHQYCSIIIIVLLGLSKLLIKITFFEINYYFILQNFLLDFVTTIIYGYLKGLMNYKFFSIFKCNYLPGLINTVITTICYFTLGKDINNFINQTDNGNISIEFDDTSNIVFSAITLISSAFYGIFMNKILNNYTIFHIFLPLYAINFFYHIQDKAIKENLFEYILLIIIDVIEFITILVFLELIEINLCSLSYNTKKNIRNRAYKESPDLDNENQGKSYDNNSENESSLINDEIDEENSSNIEDGKIELNFQQTY